MKCDGLSAQLRDEEATAARPLPLPRDKQLTKCQFLAVIAAPTVPKQARPCIFSLFQI